MKAGSILLDTNIISDLNNNVPETTSFLKAANEIFTASIVAGELFYGIENSSRREENLKFYRDFFAACAVLDVTIETAELYGRIKTQLKNKGRPVPENDLWIAAIAMQYELTLVTRDRHFEHIEGLDLKLL